MNYSMQNHTNRIRVGIVNTQYLRKVRIAGSLKDMMHLVEIVEKVPILEGVELSFSPI